MTKYLLLLLSLLVGSASLAQQGDKKNITLISKVSFNERLNDIWGYSDSQGNEYALVGLRTGVSIVNVSSPTFPQVVANLPGVFSTWRDLKTWGDYAYISNESSDGIRIINLSSLPNFPTYKDTALGGISRSHNLWVDERGILYVCGSNVISGLMMFDLSVDPWNPPFIGSYGDRYVHDVYVRNGLAYLAEISTSLPSYLTILDVSDPSNPIILGRKTYSGAFTHNTWLNDAGTVCFTTDELADAAIRSWDVSDPTNIQELDTIKSSIRNPITIPHNTHVLNDFLVTSYYTDGAHIVDATYPSYLVETGFYDTSDSVGAQFSGAWGAYPFLPSGNLLISDIEEGLFVLKPSYTRAAFLDATVVDANTGNPIQGVDIAFASQTATTDALGGYFYGQADSGTFQLDVSAFGYLDKTVSIALQNGVTVDTTIELTPRQIVSYTIDVRSAEDSSALRDAPFILKQLNGAFEISFRTNVQGQFTQSLEVGDYKLTVGKWGYKTQEITVNAGQAGPVATVYLEPGYADDFALDLGWNVLSGNDGRWERGIPQSLLVAGTEVSPLVDIANDNGEECYITGIQETVPNGEETEFVSPPIDLSTMQEPVMRLNYWLINQVLPSGPNGDGFLRIKLSNGISDFNLLTLSDPFSTNWKSLDSIPLTNFLSINGPVFIKFTAKGAGNSATVNAAIDDFEIFDAFVAEPVDTTSTQVDIEKRVREFALVAENELVQINYELADNVQNQPYNVVFYDIHGRQLKAESFTARSGRLNIPFPHARGIYIVKMVDGKGQMLVSEKFSL